MARNANSGEPQAARDAHLLLNEAYQRAKRYVRTIVSAIDEREHGDLLNDWVSFIEHRALVVLLRVPNDANAYKMFETLNDRGLRTSQADLIKNYLFSRSGDRIDEVQSRWSYMRGTLESLDAGDITVDFLRHALIAIRGHTRESQVYDAVQERVKSDYAAIAFAANLEHLANAYVATFNSEHERWNECPDATRRSLEVLNMLNIRPLRPMLLAVTRAPCT